MEFSYLIIVWYGKYKRDLPWRRTSDPYLIWVSEVILQQTRVEQGLAYYERFTERFPDVGSLAEAGEDEVMKLWQGLGYYSRARHMHQAAKSIYDERRGQFPASYNELLKMKGIGEYSAGAISSIAYGEPQPVIDGNVMRVMARYTGITIPVNTAAGIKSIRVMLETLIDKEQPGVFNQALMELGALVCKPKQPLCHLCPLTLECHAFLHNKTTELPVLKKSTAFKTRYLHYLFIISNQNSRKYTWIKKRLGNDIWKNLYDFPLIESDHEMTDDDLYLSGEFQSMMAATDFHLLFSENRMKHLLSHQELIVRFFIIKVNDFKQEDCQKIILGDLRNYPVPRLIENFLKKVHDRPGIFSENPD